MMGKPIHAQMRLAFSKKYLIAIVNLLRKSQFVNTSTIT
jgi:hypothetical protein